MKTSDFSRHALGTGLAVAMLAGCGGSQSPMTPGTVPQSAATMPHGSGLISLVRSDSKLSGETLTSTKVRSYCTKPPKGAPSGKFHVHGTASGPFPGTFTASGRAGFEFTANGQAGLASPNQLVPFLDERFTIRSGSVEISGHTVQGGPIALGQVSCLKHKHILSFHFSKLRYKVETHPPQLGRNASATLKRGSFSESFK